MDMLLKDDERAKETTIVLLEMTEDVAARLRQHHTAAFGIALGIFYSKEMEDREFRH